MSLTATVAMAAEVKVLSAGAVEPGLHKAVALFQTSSGHTVSIQFNTAPQIAKRMADGYVADILISPPGGLKQFAEEGKVAKDGHVALGKVGAGVAIRPDAPVPDIKTTDALKAAVLAADSLVYNSASTGAYLETMFDKLGVGDQIKAKTTRYASGEAVMEHIIKSKGREIGFGAITEIKLYEVKGTLKLVGPLPADVQNYTSYSAGMMSNAPSPDAAKAFMAFLGTPAAKQAFVSAGVE
ncbi:MAG: transporter substrate-binding protein [Rhodoferax sp.]|nr:transporter substrate-binding protein [Rhodoferax sp.]